MDNINDAPLIMNEGQPLPWYQVWKQVITRPSRDTFRRILADPTARPQRAFLWAAVIGLVTGVLQAVIFQVFGPDPMRALGGLPRLLTNWTCIAIAAPAVWVTGLAISAGMMRLIAALLGGRGNYSDLVYAVGAAQTPVGLMITLFWMIANVTAGGVNFMGPLASRGPGLVIVLCMAPLVMALWVYAVSLVAMALDTVEKFGKVKAMITVMIPAAMLNLVGGCIVVGVTARLYEAYNY